MPSINYKTRKAMLTAEVRRAGPAAVAIFRAAFKKPDDLEFAAMCALRAPSGARYTDKAVDEGIHRQMGQELPYNRKKIMAIAKKAGINVGNKVYKGGLGRPDNPLAWVTCADDIRRSAKAQNLTVDGAVRVQGHVPEYDPAKAVALAPDLVAEFAQKYTAADPNLAAKVKTSRKARRELHERIIATHGRKKK